ncbi:MAG TPA: hypothetical protein VEO53_02330, partial [Candidatus Binatia bacterium]|nr:hypothetical protein [Candidatus Binatia bacterium]
EDREKVWSRSKAAVDADNGASVPTALSRLGHADSREINWPPLPGPRTPPSATTVRRRGVPHSDRTAAGTHRLR